MVALMYYCMAIADLLSDLSYQMIISVNEYEGKRSGIDSLLIRFNKGQRPIIALLLYLDILSTTHAENSPNYSNRIS
jgi:hypothetical protein